MPCSTITNTPSFLLMGDSHAGAIGKAARAENVPFCGGPIGSGREFNVDFFDIEGGDIVFRKAEANRFYRGFLDELGVSRIGELSIPVVATFGFSVHFFATRENWGIYRVASDAFEPGFLGGRLFEEIICEMARDALGFYRHLRALGLRVIAALPPQRVPALSDAEVFVAAQEVLRRRLEAMGVEVVDVRPGVLDDTGFLRAELCESNDPIHGNVAFGKIVLGGILERCRADRQAMS